MTGKTMMQGLLAAALVTFAVTVQADVFKMPGGQTSLQFATVGDPGNPPDTQIMDDGTTGYGSVPYVYQMGKYDVTVGQYVQFLNAVATTGDPYGLYNSGISRHFRTWQSARSAVRAAIATNVTGQQPGAQLSDRQCLLGRCGAVLQLAAKRPADRGRRHRHDGRRGLIPWMVQRPSRS